MLSKEAHMFDLTANEISNLHHEALRRSVCASQSLHQAGFGSAPLGLRTRVALGDLLIRSGQRLKQQPLPQPDPAPALFIML
jgi:hypothetical protein